MPYCSPHCLFYCPIAYPTAHPNSYCRFYCPTACPTAHPNSYCLFYYSTAPLPARLPTPIPTACSTTLLPTRLPTACSTTLLPTACSTTRLPTRLPAPLRHCLFYYPTALRTHTHPLNGPFSGTTQVSQYQKGKTNVDFTEARDREWQWHQLGHMQICTSLQTDNHTSTPPLCFLQAGCPSCRPTNSVKALKARHPTALLPTPLSYSLPYCLTAPLPALMPYYQCFICKFQVQKLAPTFVTGQ